MSLFGDDVVTGFGLSARCKNLRFVVSLIDLDISILQKVLNSPHILHGKLGLIILRHDNLNTILNKTIK